MPGAYPSAVDVCSFLTCSVSNDRAEALRRAIEAGAYTFLQSSDAMVRYNGLEKEQAVLREAIAAEGLSAPE